MHTTMQTLGRVAIIGGGVLVSAVNVLLFAGVGALPEAQKVAHLPPGLPARAGHPAGLGGWA